MRLIKQLLILIFLSACLSAQATTYYGRADGTVTAALKANATSPNAAATSLSMATANGCTFAAGDQVLFSSQGGNFTATLTVPTGGSGVGAEVTYSNVPTETPVITMSSAAGGMIATNTKSNIIISGFALVYTGTTTTDDGVRISAGSNITISTMSINMGAYGVGIYSSAAINNATLDHLTITNCGASGQGVYCYGTGTTALSLAYITCDTGANNAIQIRNTTGLTMNHLTLGGSITLNAVTSATCSNIGVTPAASKAAYGFYTLGASSSITLSDYTYSGDYYPVALTATTTGVTISGILVMAISSRSTSMRSDSFFR